MTQDRFLEAPARALAGHDGAPLLQQAGAFVRITLNRPSEHNRLDPADVDALSGLFADLERERSVRAIVFTGNGPRTFSSGYTLQSIVQELDARFEHMLDTLEALPMPTLVAFNGNVYGGATDLALCCDIRLGIHGMKMFMPAARFALHYYPGGMRRYVTRLGLNAAKKLFLTAMTIESDEMLRIGFLTELDHSAWMPGRIEQYLQAWAETDPTVVAQMKRHLNQLADGNAELSLMAQAYAQSLASPELKARLATLLRQ